MACSYVLAHPNLVISITSIYATASKTAFSFIITNFLNPPSEQPANNFLFQTYNSTGTDAVLID